jgi:capsule biosynthesis phosphatase
MHVKTEQPNINDKRRICFDLDGTICYTKKPGEKYEDVLPLPGAIETLKQLKDDGWYIIIATARNMRTYNHNVGQVAAFQTKIVVDWLTKWQIPFDELWVKPHVSLFIDDKGVKFENWNQIKEVIADFEKDEGL